MIGEPVSSDEFEKVLLRQAARDKELLEVANDKFVKQMEEELKAIKPGECLLYKLRPEAPSWASIGSVILVEKIKGLKVMQEQNCTYVYREKR